MSLDISVQQVINMFIRMNYMQYQPSFLRYQNEYNNCRRLFLRLFFVYCNVKFVIIYEYLRHFILKVNKGSEEYELCV